MDKKAQFADVKNYAVGMAIEVAAICAIILAALFVGFILVSWYRC